MSKAFLRLALLGLAVLASPVASTAQAPVDNMAPGDRVRLKLVGIGDTYSGRVAIVARDTLWLESGAALHRAVFARAEIASLRRRVGGPSGAGKGALLGGGLGVLLGSLPLVLGCSRCDFDPARYALLVGGILGVGGAALGAGVGAIVAPAEWREAYWPLAPPERGSRRFDLGLAVRF
jgi:hypothetical protein